MNYYIFLTNQGSTYQPNYKSIEPDCDNIQVIGIASGNNEDEAFDSLKKKIHIYLQCLEKDENFQDICKNLTKLKAGAAQLQTSAFSQFRLF